MTATTNTIGNYIDSANRIVRMQYECGGDDGISRDTLMSHNLRSAYTESMRLRARYAAEAARYGETINDCLIITLDGGDDVGMYDILCGVTDNYDASATLM